MNLLKEKIAAAGVVGAGGAGFPSAFKLADNIDTILINAAECEPLLFTDYYILKEKKKEVEQALELLVAQAGAKRGVIAMKRHVAVELGIEDGAFAPDLEYKVIDDIYPAGDELVLILEALGKVVPASSLPISVGVVVYNLETLYNILNAINDIPVTRKYLTIGGDTGKTYVTEVPIGTPLSYILEQLQIEVDDDHVILDGGPAMGRIVGKDAVVTKTTKSYLVLPKSTTSIQNKTANISVQLKRASSACCGCRLCTDLCPRHLLGYDIEPHKIVKTVANGVSDAKVFLGSYLCCNCGVCDTVACCQGLSPRAVFQNVKAELQKAGIRPQPKEAAPHPLRDYRKMPVQRLINRLGVNEFYRHEYEVVTLKEPEEVTINLRQHIGGIYPVCVQVGQEVKAGTPLVSKGEGLGAIVHASIDGKVLSITNTCVKVGANE